MARSLRRLGASGASAGPREGPKSTGWELREAIAENGDVLVAGAGASSRQGVSRVAAAGPQARPSPAPPGPASAAAAQEAVSQARIWSHHDGALPAEAVVPWPVTPPKVRGFRTFERAL